MMRKAFYASLSLAISSLSFAGTMGPVVLSDFKPKESFYAGIGFGGRFSHNTESVTALSNQNYTQTTVSTNQAVGNVYIGYGHTWMEKYFLGIEANTYFPGYSADITTAGVSNVGSNNFYTNRFTYNDYLGLDLLPGWRFHPNSLIYARTGLSFRNIEVNQNSTFTPESEGYYNSGHSVGGRFGAGIAHGFNENIGVAVDYFYTYYPRWGSYWSTYNLQQDMKSYQNYVGISLIYTS
jgi:hypothetical protein